ncbi:MAG TPA: DUF1501 domain-containing protein [Pirellulales bacterium]|jgi:hypothetical protein|nr:DUF1501 domain-containing protein [Pirellulales bacterium]
MAGSRCGGPLQRREFLRLGTLALGGLGLSDLLAARAASNQPSSDTTVILFWMWGGPSQLETYDCKPNAPSEYRGPLRPIKTTVPGIEIAEVFPLQAKLAHRFSLVRSLHHGMSSHNDGSIELLTGKTPAKEDPTSTAKSDHPDVGMVTSRMRGPDPSGLPRYVGIPRVPFMVQPTYLGMTHSGFAAGDPSAAKFRPPNLSLDAGLNGERLDDRRGLVRQLDRYRRAFDLQGAADATDAFRQQAFQLLTSKNVADAFALERETPETRERYGRHLWGQSCLLARRLAEAGTSVITIDALSPVPTNPIYFSWDDHSNPATGWNLEGAMRWRAPFMDQGLSALIEDIYARSLDRKIMVVAVGEFGRTPRLATPQGVLGRDHWPAAQSALISGGGLRMGQVVGATTSKAEYPVERPLAPQDLLATIYRHLGINPKATLNDFSGRPVEVLSFGEPIRELI